MDSPGAAGSTPVFTSAELVQEVRLGTPHIVLQEHLDLRQQPQDPNASDAGELLVVKNTTQSIRGNCTSLPPPLDGVSPPLTPTLGPGQCLLQVNRMFARMPFDGALWLDSLYIRVERPSDQKRNLIPLLQPSSIGHSLYLTYSTLQGDAPDGQTRGLDVADGARVYIEESRFAHLYTVHGPGVLVRNVPGQLRYGAALHGVEFLECRAAGTGIVDVVEDAAVLERCAFRGVRGTYLVSRADAAGQVYSDPQLDVWDQATATLVPSLPLSQMPANNDFLSGSDEWFVAAQLALPPTAQGLQRQASTGTPAPSPATFAPIPNAPPVSESSGGGVSVALIVAVVLGCLLAVALAVLACFFVAWRRRHRSPNSKKQHARPNPSEQMKFSGDAESERSCFGCTSSSRLTSPLPTKAGSVARAGQSPRALSASGGSTHPSPTLPGPPLGPGVHHVPHNMHSSPSSRASARSPSGRSAQSLNLEQAPGVGHRGRGPPSRWSADSPGKGVAHQHRPPRSPPAPGLAADAGAAVMRPGGHRRSFSSGSEAGELSSHIQRGILRDDGAAALGHHPSARSFAGRAHGGAGPAAAAASPGHSPREHQYPTQQPASLPNQGSTWMPFSAGAAANSVASGDHTASSWDVFPTPNIGLLTVPEGSNGGIGPAAVSAAAGQGGGGAIDSVTLAAAAAVGASKQGRGPQPASSSRTSSAASSRAQGSSAFVRQSQGVAREYETPAGGHSMLDITPAQPPAQGRRTPIPLPLSAVIADTPDAQPPTSAALQVQGLHAGEGTQAAVATRQAYAALAGVTASSEGANSTKRPSASLAQHPAVVHGQSVLPHAGAAANMAGAAGGAAGGTAGGAAASGKSVPPPVIDPNKAPLDALEDALDWMSMSNRAFLGQYLVLGSRDRRRGGQGVVQFMRSRVNGEEFAVKFYAGRSAFERERRLYMDPALRPMMPATRALIGNYNGAVRGPNGYRFPPCIIIEKGESLKEWARREARPDFVTTMQVLCHVASRLQLLHAAGWAHRDVKPGNVLRRPRQHSWTLIDFGCAARAGARASLSYSLAYAPPEIIAAIERRATTVIVSMSIDIWALGVIAFELLTGLPPFPPGLPRSEVRDQIAGRKPLIWERTGTQECDDALAMLRGLRRSVLKCLNRDPERRPTCEALLAAWNHMFDRITSTTAAPATNDGPLSGADVGEEDGERDTHAATGTSGDGVGDILADAAGAGLGLQDAAAAASQPLEDGPGTDDTTAPTTPQRSARSSAGDGGEEHAHPRPPPGCGVRDMHAQKERVFDPACNTSGARGLRGVVRAQSRGEGTGASPPKGRGDKASEHAAIDRVAGAHQEKAALPAPVAAQVQAAAELLLESTPAGSPGAHSAAESLSATDGFLNLQRQLNPSQAAAGGEGWLGARMRERWQTETSMSVDRAMGASSGIVADDERSSLQPVLAPSGSSPVAALPAQAAHVHVTSSSPPPHSSRSTTSGASPQASGSVGELQGRESPLVGGDEAAVEGAQLQAGRWAEEEGGGPCEMGIGPLAEGGNGGGVSSSCGGGSWGPGMPGQSSSNGGGAAEAGSAGGVPGRALSSVATDVVVAELRNLLKTSSSGWEMDAEVEGILAGGVVVAEGASGSAAGAGARGASSRVSSGPGGGAHTAGDCGSVEPALYER